MSSGHATLHVSKRAKCEPQAGKPCNGLFLVRGSNVVWEPDQEASQAGAQAITFLIASITGECSCAGYWAGNSAANGSAVCEAWRKQAPLGARMTSLQ